MCAETVVVPGYVTAQHHSQGGECVPSPLYFNIDTMLSPMLMHSVSFVEAHGHILDFPELLSLFTVDYL